MIIKELKCQRCGHRFESEVLDRDDPKEEYIQGSPVRCPQCQSTFLDTVRVLRKAS